MAKISVIIPSYNRAHCIAACISSVLTQTMQDLEVIVVDDNSTDNTKEVIKKITDPRVKYFCHEKNQGGAVARNTGIKNSSGEFIAFLDSDDLWLPEKLEKQIQLLESKGDDFGLCYTWFILQDPDGNEIMRLEYKVTGKSNPDLLVKNCVGTFSSVIFRKTVLDKINGLDEKMRSCQDWDLFIRANQVTDICYVPEYLVIYLQDKKDKFRISSNPSAVIDGHKRMLIKNKPLYDKIDKKVYTAVLKNFVHTFSVIGSIDNTIMFGLKVISLSPSICNILWFAKMIARIFKKKLTNSFGY
jgi:glycosyltransferase involved in cell wall biosynthesis